MATTRFYLDTPTVEIGVDEAGRGPLFGPVYVGAVILPKDNDEFNFALLKDSKRFTSVKKIEEAANYIKENAVAWSVRAICEKEIDKINIRQATLKGMHLAIKDVLNTTQSDQYKKTDLMDYLLLVDGNDFKPLYYIPEDGEGCDNEPILLNHVCVKGGDNIYNSIAAASILAKVERDAYIKNLCDSYPLLSKYYGIDKNKGYGAKQHMQGITTYGISQWHRTTFGICKMAKRIVL